MNTFIGFTEFGFWTVIGLAVVIMAALTQSPNKDSVDHRFIWLSISTMFISLFLFLGLHQTMSNIFKDVTWYYFILSIIFYLWLGLMWSFVMWIIFNIDIKKDFFRLNTSTVANYENYIESFLAQKPKVANHIEELITWIIFWPFCLLKYMVSDLVYKIITWLILVFLSYYEDLTDRIFKLKN